MKSPKREFQEIIKKTRIIKNPKHRLITFGQTKISYYFLSEVKGFKDRSRLREGLVIAEKPQIITPESMKGRFEGFGKDSGRFSDWLTKQYGSSFQGLQYQFKNESKSVHIEHSTLKNLSDQIANRLDREELFHSAIIEAPDKTWHISLMKFIVDECMASFADNVRELDEHGFFDTPESNMDAKIKEIEKLFISARRNRASVPHLGRKLHQYGLFKEYEDKFFKLLKN